MSAGLIFDEETFLEGNINQYEQRLHSHVNKYAVEGGALLTTYYKIREDATTVDRGLRDIDILFGNKSPLRFDKILNFPVYGFGTITPNNVDDIGIEDITVEGECVIQPSTLVPNPNDFFMINHLKMYAIFQVIDVQYDSMKIEGFYKIRYRLHSTSLETFNKINKQAVETFHTDLNAVGSNVNPIITEDNFIKIKKIRKMVDSMIDSYRSLFYNTTHNCFLFHHPEQGLDWFDMCGNEFMARHNLMNQDNSSNVIVLHDKVIEPQFNLYYNSSIYNWIELGCPRNLLQKFHFNLTPASCYKGSSFDLWGDHNVQIMRPLAIHQVGINNDKYSYFDDTQLETFNDKSMEPYNDYEKLIHKYINYPQNISIEDISLNLSTALLSSINHIDVFIYTPIIIYIIRYVLQLN